MELPFYIVQLVVVFFSKKFSIIASREGNVLLLSKVVEKYPKMLEELSAENKKILIKIKKPQKREVLDGIYSPELRSISKRKHPSRDFIDYHLNFYGHNYTNNELRLIKKFESVDEIKALRVQKKIREEESERKRLKMEKLRKLKEEQKLREAQEREEKIKKKDSLPKLSGSLTIGLSYEYLENNSKDIEIEYREFDYLNHIEKDNGIVYLFESEGRKEKVMISLFINEMDFDLKIDIKNHKYEMIKNQLVFNLPKSEIIKLF